MSKEIDNRHGAKMAEDFLKYLRPSIDVKIVYDIPTDCVHQYGEWETKYLNLIDNEEYFFVYYEGNLLYAVNVTADSTLTAVYELFDLLAKKF